MVLRRFRGDGNDDNYVIEQARAMQPWHFEYDLGDGVMTTALNTEKISHMHDRMLRNITRRLFGPKRGLQGKRFLDVGCNSGGYCFAARDLGAAETYGFDVRQHWIDQATFIRDEVRREDPKAMRFEQNQIAHVAAIGEQYDMTMFKGVLYHLADPIEAIRALASATSDVMILNTAGSGEVPADSMQVYAEDPDLLMNGVDGLAWLPGGPDVFIPILRWAGMPAVRSFGEISTYRPHALTREMIRFTIVAAKSEDTFARWDAAAPPS